MSGANLLSWFSLGVLAAAPAAVWVPEVGMELAFLLTMFGLLGSLLAHAVAEDRRDRAAIVRVAAGYILCGAWAAGGGLYWMTVALIAGAAATAWQAQRWAHTHPTDVDSTTPAFS